MDLFKLIDNIDKCMIDLNCCNSFLNIGRKNGKLVIIFDKMVLIVIRFCMLICFMLVVFNVIFRMVELILELGYWFGIVIV